MNKWSSFGLALCFCPALVKILVSLGHLHASYLCGGYWWGCKAEQHLSPWDAWSSLSCVCYRKGNRSSVQVPLVRSQACVSQHIQEGDSKQLFITVAGCLVTLFSNPGGLQEEAREDSFPEWKFFRCRCTLTLHAGSTLPSLSFLLLCWRLSLSFPSELSWSLRIVQH